jgi:hypothetical protein
MSSGNLDIERLDNTTCNEYTDNVLVVWVASKPKGNNVYIVGWYKNATVYREEQPLMLSVNMGDYSWYMLCCNVEDGMLLTEVDRKLRIPFAPMEGKDKGKGQSNIWYAEDMEIHQNLIPRILSYINRWDKPSADIILTDSELIQRDPAQGGVI